MACLCAPMPRTRKRKRGRELSEEEIAAAANEAAKEAAARAAVAAARSVYVRRNERRIGRSLRRHAFQAGTSGLISTESAPLHARCLIDLTAAHGRSTTMGGRGAALAVAAALAALPAAVVGQQCEE